MEPNNEIINLGLIGIDNTSYAKYIIALHTSLFPDTIM